MKNTVNLAICASGRGSNAEAIMKFSLTTESNFRVALIISNNSKADVMRLADDYGIDRLHLSTVTHPEPGLYSAAFLRALEERDVRMIALAGYMKKIPSAIIERFAGRIFNIHPALLPKFGGEGMYGIHVHRAVLQAGERSSGATVHLVADEYDTGAILYQESVPLSEGETEESLAGRILEIEHRIYPQVLNEAARRILALTNDI